MTDIVSLYLRLGLEFRVSFMNRNETNLVMDLIFSGAARVLAKNHVNRVRKNVYRNLLSRILS